MPQANNERMVEAALLLADFIDDYELEGEDVVNISIDSWGKVDLHLENDAFARITKRELVPGHNTIVLDMTFAACTIKRG